MIRVLPQRGPARGRRIACGARSVFRRVGQGLSLIIVYRFTPLLAQGPDCSLDIRVIPASSRLKAGKARIPGWAILRLSPGICSEIRRGGRALGRGPGDRRAPPRMLSARADLPRERLGRRRPLSHAGQRDMARPAQAGLPAPSRPRSRAGRGAGPGWGGVLHRIAGDGFVAAPERWPSGRRRTPGKCVGGEPSRGFESLSLRQTRFPCCAARFPAARPSRCPALLPPGPFRDGPRPGPVPPKCRPVPRRSTESFLSVMLLTGLGTPRH